ncbi:UNVERIFIED_CONTAM: hypothetical protein FKN15_019470 [Acipenser sinensis]
MVHTMIENSAPRPQLYQQAKLSRLCKQDKLVRTQEEKLQQLHREKHTLEQALLSASQEIEMNADNPAAIQSVIQQRDVLQNGLLSTCRERSRANASESSSLHHANIQKELWRIEDVIEALGKNKPQRNKEDTELEASLQGGDLERNHETPAQEIARLKGAGQPGECSVDKEERPRSAVEQLCLMESSRPRMSVEEQMERMKRHQQASLREKKKGLNIIASHENSPSRSPSFSKENPFKSAQLCKMEDAMSSNIKELEASLQGGDLERNHETPAQEIARLKGAGQPGECSVDKELSTPEKVLIPERYIESDPEEVLSPEESADKQKKVDRIKAILAKNSMQNAVPVVNHKTEDHTEEEVNAQEQEKILNISYKLAAEASKRSKLVAGAVQQPFDVIAVSPPIRRSGFPPVYHWDDVIALSPPIRCSGFSPVYH